jgi:hypothetical protein
MKYQIINTSLFFKGKLHPENSVTEMSEKQAEEFSDYLEPVEPGNKQKKNQQPKSKKKT